MHDSWLAMINIMEVMTPGWPRPVLTADTADHLMVSGGSVHKRTNLDDSNNGVG